MIFQLLDIDYIFNGRPIVRMFGRTENSSVCVFCDNFYPYFYAKPKDKNKALAGIDKIKEIKDIEIVERMNPIGYHNEKEKVLKITLFNPQNVPMVREKLLSEQLVEETYESDILFKYRFMVDHGIHGMDWLEVDTERSSSSTIAVPSYYTEKIKRTEKSDNSDLRYMAFDIETIPIDKTKPIDPRNLKTIMISMAFSHKFDGKKSLVLLAKPARPEKSIRAFPNEKEMLTEFSRIMQAYDPDIITGYNIDGFDIPTILEAYKRNELLPVIGRCKKKQAYSKTFGITQESVIPGRVVVDPFQILKRDPWVKFIRYDLNTVSLHLLGEGKDDVDHKEIEILWNGSEKELKRLIDYARKDAELALRLLLEKGLLDKFFEISRISGVTLQDSLGGQSLRIETMILHEFSKRGYLMPAKPSAALLTKRSEQRKELKGAIVLEPEKGLHTDGCIIVLDFKSLYPSIMRTFNISPDTVLTNEKGKIEIKHQTSPVGTKFLSSSIREGVFPALLKRLINARLKTKKKMLHAAGEERRVLNARQLALKDISNSFYGYTGYVRARLFTIDVAKSITAIGRENIEKTKKMVEDEFGLKVVYGDTDSIFLKTGKTNLDEVMKIGENVSAFVTKKLPGLLELEFEKIYRTFLILTKKRYVGWSFVRDNGEWKDKIEMKGIETVRRDWCPLVSEIMLEIINMIMKKGDLKEAIERVRETIEKLKKNEIPIEKLTIIKGITKHPNKYDGILPHIELAKKLLKRNPQNAPQIGDRLGFVIIKGTEMLSKRSEDPRYAQEKKMQIDSDYYIQNQLFPPIERIFAAAGITKSEIFGLGRQTSLDDILNGTKRQMKRNIRVDYAKIKKNKEKIEAELNDWDCFVCDKCGKCMRRMPLRGECDCGGSLLICSNGKKGEKIILK